MTATNNASEELTADAFAEKAFSSLLYGYSMFVCLPDGLSSPPSAGTGTVLRKPILDSYAQQAGFSSVEVLPFKDFAFFRFYQLNH
jgi:hypothetical protein